MAAPALRWLLWPAVSVLAAAVIVVLAHRGERPGAGFSRWEPTGPMVHVAPSTVKAVEIASAGRRRRFVRAEGGWKAEPPARAAAPAEEIEAGLHFLHGSAPQRVIAPEELVGTALAELGLSPPRVVVSVFGEGAQPFVIELGAPNPQGLARYARIAGHREVLLLNRYVAEPWEKAAAP